MSVHKYFRSSSVVCGPAAVTHRMMKCSMPGVNINDTHHVVVPGSTNPLSRHHGGWKLLQYPCEVIQFDRSSLRRS